MAKNVYEGMLILDSNRYGRDQAAVSGQIPEMIEDLGGEILVSRLWEERRLAYTIRGQRKGTYWLTYFRIEGDQLVELERRCRLSDSILRALFLKVDPRIVDTLVTHAQAVSGHVAEAKPVGKPTAVTEDASADKPDEKAAVAVADAPAADAEKTED